MHNWKQLQRCGRSLTSSRAATMATRSAFSRTDCRVAAAAFTVHCGSRRRIRPDSISYLVTVLLFLLQFSQISGSGMFQLTIGQFHNGLGLTENGACCVPDPSNNGNPCPGYCRPFLRLCLSHYQHSIPDNPVCSHGLNVTGVLGIASETLASGHRLIQDPRTSAGLEDPVNFSFDYGWPGSFSLIIEAWHDLTGNGPSEGSPRRLIWRMATSHLLQVGRTWTTRKFQPNISSTSEVTYNYRVVCDVNHYGNDCNTYCSPRDDIHGHYVCNEDGVVVCRDGWTGKFCKEVMCSEGCRGVCVRPLECRCRQGWHGPLCDKCVVHPDCNHGYCTTPFQCICEKGWTGENCDQELDYCSRHNPCRHHGVCTNTSPGRYECHCQPGYRGVNCEIDVNDCLLEQRHGCLNGGTCSHVDSSATRRHECRCPPGYTGTRCEWSSSDDCRHSPCRHGGTCVDVSGSGRHQCQCTPGYAGQRCEINVDECQSSPCRNGGQCIDHVNSFRCLCPPGFGGRHCDVAIDYCQTSAAARHRLESVDQSSRATSDGPCLNGATCTSGRNSFVCHCAPGFDGVLCQFDRFLDERSRLVDHSRRHHGNGTRPRCTAATCQEGATCVERHYGDSDDDVIVLCLCPSEEAVVDSDGLPQVTCYSDASQRVASGLLVPPSRQPPLVAHSTSSSQSTTTLTYDKAVVVSDVVTSSQATEKLTITLRSVEQSTTSTVLFISVVVAGVVTAAVAVTVTVAVVFCVRRRNRSRDDSDKCDRSRVDNASHSERIATASCDVNTNNNNHIKALMTLSNEKNVSVDVKGRNLLPVGIRLNNELYQ